MYAHQSHIIKEYISTALISDDPEEALLSAFEKVIELAEKDVQFLYLLLEYLYEKEKELPIMRTT